MSYAPGLIVLCLILLCSCRRSLESFFLNIINVVNSPIIFGSLNRYRENHMISPVPMSYSGDYG